MRHALIYWALAGVVVPVTLLTIAFLQGGVFADPYLLIALWPAAIFLMGIQTWNAFAVLVLLAAIGINVIWYIAVGVMVRLLFGPLFR